MSEVYTASYYPKKGHNRATCLIVKATDAHAKMGGVGFAYCGTPGSSKGEMKYAPLMMMQVPNAFLYTQVSWAKLWIYVYTIIGTPPDVTNYLYRCTRPGLVSPYDYTASDYWRDYWVEYRLLGPGGEEDEADYTCYQHSEHAWTAGWGDWSATPAPVGFTGPAATGWKQITITDHVKWALQYNNGYVNILICPSPSASTAFFFYTTNEMVYSNLIPYIEVEWTGGQRTRSQV